MPWRLLHHTPYSNYCKPAQNLGPPQRQGTTWEGGTDCTIALAPARKKPRCSDPTQGWGRESNATLLNDLSNRERRDAGNSGQISMRHLGSGPSHSMKIPSYGCCTRLRTKLRPTGWFDVNVWTKSQVFYSLSASIGASTAIRCNQDFYA